ncbi:MAG: UbiD family decarboxylase [Pirellulales bacterium]|nr:UbiD family decarboxylase [Pirellulales bacterium]
MGYRSLRECIDDLDRTGQLVRIKEEIDPHLEAAAIQRRVYAAGGPALLYERVRGCQFPLASNLFGTIERARFLFRDTLAAVRQLIELKGDPAAALRRPWRYRRVALATLHALPKRVRRAAVLANEISVDRLPAVKSWPNDGGAFITLPAVYTEDVERPGWQRSNLGMYRVQLDGGQYARNHEIGLHYQIHRGIGVHHAAAVRRGVPLRVNIFVGGPPALILSAVMPLPEGMPELSFAGALGGRRLALNYSDKQLPIVAEADFCITGTVDPDRLLPEGPFGDHLGYYSLAHEFPVLRVEHVYHREGAIWPFTVVGRPPQEDTTFGQLIHELTGPAIPMVVPGLHAVHAVDAAGVHPLLLAIGSERYVPFAERRQPQELLTIANAILGQGQMSLAKYLLIVARDDDPALDAHDIAAFIRHLLARVDWRRDLHFQTRTTIDTLDYSGTGLNEGSKVVIAAAGPPVRELPTELPQELTATAALPEGFDDPRVCLPGVLAIRGPRWSVLGRGDQAVARFCQQLDSRHEIAAFPLVVVVDDSRFVAETLGNFLWTAFTRSDPAADIDGIESFVEQKHWGCRGPLVIDARAKPHHAPPLVEDPQVSRRVDKLGAPGGPLHGII